MISLLLFLSLFPSPHGYPKNNFEVSLTVEAAYFESCVNIEPIWGALEQLRLLGSSLNRQTSRHSKTYLEQNDHLQKFVQSLQLNINSEIHSVVTKLNQLGLSMSAETNLNHKFNQLSAFQKLISRNKRGAFNFVSEGASYLFGFVSASQYKDMKNNIRRSFSVIHDHQNQLLQTVSDNRDHLNSALKSIFSLKSDVQYLVNRLEARSLNSEHLLSMSIQVSYLLTSIQALVSTFEVVRSDSDHFYPSRYVTTPAQLRSFILYLSDSLTDISPIFSSTSIGNYYRYKIATTSYLDNKICQLVRVPLTNQFGQLWISHKHECPAGRICLLNHLGHSQISVSDYISCLGVHTPDLPTLCSTRPCLTTNDISCIMINSTTALVAVVDPFMITVKCERMRSIEMTGIKAIRIPLNCFIQSPKLKIDRVQLLKHNTTLRIIDIPFSIVGNTLTVNDTALGESSVFENSQLGHLLLPKLKRKFNSTIFTYHTSRNLALSSTATVVSLAICLLLLLLLVRKILKARDSCPDSSTSFKNSEKSDDRRGSLTEYDPDDCRRNVK